MRFQYLGTAAAEGFPGLFCECAVCKKATALGGKNIRGRSGAIIDGKMLIDFPPDLYFHKIRFGLDLSLVESALITHSHSDHFCLNEMENRQDDWAAIIKTNAGKPIAFYGNDQVVQEIANRRYVSAHGAYITGTKLPLFEKHSISGYGVTALKAFHMDDELCYIYLIESPEGKRFLYGNDTGALPEETLTYLKGIYIDVISLDATHGTVEGSDGHMTLKQNGEMKQRFLENGTADDKTLFISHHISHECNMTHEELSAEAAKIGFIVSYDGMVINL